MSVIRATIRSVGFTATTLFHYLVYLAGRGILALLNRDSAAWRVRMTRRWAHSTAGIIGINLTIKGTPPDAPFFLVCNHLSYIDIIPLYLTTNCVFVAKSEVAHWPVLGRMARDVNIIFIDRKTNRDIRRVNEVIASSISECQGVILFPEGTSTRGERVRRFNSSLLHYAAREKIPVSYASITYRSNDSEKPAEEWVCWWGEMTFLDHFFNLLTLKSFDAEITFGEQQVWDEDRKVLAASLHRLVQQQFTPTAIANNERHG